MLKTDRDIKYLNFEINSMRLLNHPNVMGIQNVIQRDFEVILVLKFLKGLDLEHQLSKKMEENKDYMVPEIVIVFWAKQMMLGI